MNSNLDINNTRILVVGLNSQYVHSSYASYILCAVLRQQGYQPQLLEWTVNNPSGELLAGIYRQQPDIVMFSVYIWNLEYVLKIAGDLKRILPELLIVCGGPEAAANSERLCRLENGIDFVCLEEAETALPRFLCAYQGGELSHVGGFMCAGDREAAWQTPSAAIMDELNFPYTDQQLQQLAGHLVYYESSRGCPYQCSFCMSACSRPRFRSPDLVFEDLQRFFHVLPGGTIKFIDRTFNAVSSRSVQILKFLLQNYRKEFRFHFEIEPSILDEAQLFAFSQAPTGYFQIEAGLQSLNPLTLTAVNRGDKTVRALENLQELLLADNVVVHVDLIAGLPEETLESFINGFNQVHKLGAHHLQVGFLKVLPGSQLALEKENFGIIYSDTPPYKVLSTPWLSFAELDLIAQVEKMVELFYNSNRLSQTLAAAGASYPGGSFELYLELARRFEKNIKGGYSIGYKMKLLHDLLQQKLPEQTTLWQDFLRLDYLSTSFGQPLPEWLARKGDLWNELDFFHTFTFGAGPIAAVAKEPSRLRLPGKGLAHASKKAGGNFILERLS